MDTSNARRISQLAVLMTAGLPALAGMLIFRAQPILVAAIQGESGRLGLLTDLFYNHAGAALLALLGLVLLLVPAVGEFWVHESSESSRSQA